MKSFNVLFDGKQEIDYKGKIVTRYFKLDIPGEYTIKFRFISKASAFNQAIVLLFNDFVGQYYLFDKEKNLPNIRFQKENFWIETAPDEISVKIHLKEGNIFICNGSDPLGSRQICYTLHMGCAIYIEKISEKVYRFNCNDHENDDDFDDLVFEMELVEVILNY